MMLLIQSRGRMKCSELAQELEIKERQIRTYRSDLEQAGIFITYKPGAYGGYEIDKENSISNIKISLEEISILEILNEQLKYNNDIYKNEFKDILTKLKAISVENSDKSYMDYFSIQPQCNCNYEEEKQKCNDITIAYVTKRKMQIKYYSINSGYSNRVIHPYGLYNYKSDKYMVAFCENRSTFIDFKVCRIKDYYTLEEKYEVDKSFNWKEYSKNSIGIYKDDEVHIVLKVKHPFSIIIKEKIWVDNQQIIEYEDGSIIFKAIMRGYTEIKSWILSMGANVEVIEPKKLREDIIEEVKNIERIY
ncbi:WYL domain-containing transcriptional regulator [Clostridium sp. CCUG 7971]|uniref:helix-turn-helix transcriptional regulator n=1 Tax=Clostridium sp. CCUG 7971 TaxID=2811414 RepID=UPI001ABB2949|nr:WYL domain-containing transcriptional regulator [Clostridium sp. CCUG 7971]MBO3444546.1 WYL domain-containing transcriptional regulator [Clostridium sp. CCUG 7971]